MMVRKLAIATAALLAGTPGQAETLRHYAQVTLGVAQYRTARFDLDNDGQPERFLYATDPDWCGSGGCTLFVLSPHGRGFRVVLRASVTRLPVAVLPSSTRGWRDIAVAIGGGGLAPGMVRLRFNGKKYLANPTLAPRLPGQATGMRVLIAD